MTDKQIEDKDQLTNLWYELDTCIELKDEMTFELHLTQGLTKQFKLTLECATTIEYLLWVQQLQKSQDFQYLGDYQSEQKPVVKSRNIGGLNITVNINNYGS